ncbi:MAG TPA: PhzF family phenazine biosynthesis protein [Chlamydiales bacterium]|nr:PhzF family phenazine biosynthesis protein [Chlamydiales bacterium]
MIAYVARAFCHDSLGGNPAGVVIVDRELSLTSAQMQVIAKKLNFSETAFISYTESHSYKALYFTPTSQIDFCGHATLAAFGVLKQLGSLKNSVYPLETQAGKCEVVLRDHLIFLSQPLPVFGENIEKTEITPILGDVISASEPSPRIVSTGLRDIFVRVQDEKCLQSLKPNFGLMSELNKRTHSIGIHVFSLDRPGSQAIAHCRNFAPLYGIDEESATGSSNGALACYLFEREMLPLASEHWLLFRQGENLNAPSDIYVHLRTHERTIGRVECGGEVVVDEARELNVPSDIQSS